MLGSNDSSHVYFVAKGVLASNKRSYIDSKGSEVEEGAVDGGHNLYLGDDGTTTFIATLGENESGVGAGVCEWRFHGFCLVWKPDRL